MTASPAVRPNAISAILPLVQLPKASRSGAFDPLPLSFIFRKIGDSLRRRRIQSEIPSKTIERRYEMRQPPASDRSEKVCGLTLLRTTRTTISERNRPIVAVVWIHDV